MSNSNFQIVDGKRYKRVFAKYITRKGRRIYPKKAKVFSFWVLDK